MTDFDRYLTSRGHRDPVLVSNELIDLGIVPDKIITSPAVRAFQTAEIFAKKFDISQTNISKKDFLYGYFNINAVIEMLETCAG